MKKGRHRRYEEARALKRGPDIDIEEILEEDAEDDEEFFDVSGRAGWFDEDSETADSADEAHAECDNFPR